jgi:hypothetical protein
MASFNKGFYISKDILSGHFICYLLIGKFSVLHSNLNNMASFNKGFYIFKDILSGHFICYLLNS